MYTRDKKKGVGTDDEFTLKKAICTVCGQRDCPRHRQELNILAFQPWTSLEIRKSVDQTINEFLTTVFNEFVYTWYKNVSTDEEFVDELRGTIRFFASVVLRRAKKIDIPTMVTEKILKAGLQHLHAYLQARKTASEGADLQQVTLEYLGPNLHYAMNSRRSELEYLRRLVEQIFPYILPPQALQSKSMSALIREILAGSIMMPAMDAIANPDMINNLIVIFLDDTPPPVATEPPSPMVPFLGLFCNQKVGCLSDPEQSQKVSKSSLRLVLGDLMNGEKPQMLYVFMQFLKSEAAVNVLQFALDCEDFNRKILNPDLSSTDLVYLHNDLKLLYKNYCSTGGSDRINFEENIINEIKEIIEGPPEDVLKLRTSTPMFRAYEHVYNLLSYTFLPMFHQSEYYYTVICGERVASQMMKNNPARQLKKQTSISSAISSKIKGVFKPQDSRIDDYPGIENVDEADTVTIASTSSQEDNVSEDSVELFHHLEPPDLSTWRVTIPRIGARPDPENPKKQFFVFIIDVRRVDVSNDGKSMWTVPRKYYEFYVLEQKLTEFHGEFTGDCVLPPKKLMGTKNHDFMDGKRDAFEQYLQKLLTKPHLKGSQLLYNFLTEETEFNTGFDINIGRKLMSVPMKLVKQKGQHLETFLQNFATSVEPQKPVPSKTERRGSDASNMSTASEKLCMTMFENNADGLDRRDTANGDILSDKDEICGVYDTIIYVARFVYAVPDWCHHLLLTARMFVKVTLESYLDWYIGNKIEQVTQEHRLVGLIKLLEDVLFHDTDPPRTDEQKRERLEQTIQDCLDFFPQPVVSAIGAENHERGTKLIVNALQQPKLNKQLSYVLLDIVITELFPELTAPSPSQH